MSAPAEPARPLTQRQADILAFIERTVEARNAPPTRAEIAAEFGFRSANASEDHLRALARKGAIELMEGTSRGIRLPARQRPQPGGAPLASGQQLGLPLASLQQLDLGLMQPVLLPLVGRVAAGSPILAQEHVEATFPVDPRLFAARPDYLLRVRGWSMRDAGILDADLLAVRATREARAGQIVVARLGDEVTVKRLKKPAGRAGGWILQAANPDFADIVVPPDEPLDVEGVVVGLIRQQGLG
ncbi:MAG: transcriptional repressor LexA [Serpentinimonas sp.]|jgi:repressor LexA|nr:transcriptional repressor LexA [Serpentinimonas sp.]